MACDVNTLEAEVVEQASAISRVRSEAERLPRRAAPPVAAPVIADQPIAAGKDALAEQRSERIGDQNAVDEHDGLAGADLLVYELDAVDHRLLHRAPFRGVMGSPTCSAPL